MRKRINKFWWKLAGRSWRWGNFVMDLLGTKRYEDVMRNH